MDLYALIDRAGAWGLPVAALAGIAVLAALGLALRRGPVAPWAMLAPACVLAGIGQLGAIALAWGTTDGRRALASATAVEGLGFSGAAGAACVVAISAAFAHRRDGAPESGARLGGAVVGAVVMLGLAARHVALSDGWAGAVSGFADARAATLGMAVGLVVALGLVAVVLRPYPVRTWWRSAMLTAAPLLLVVAVGIASTAVLTAVPR